MPQNTVPAVMQSADGYLWAGTELGLVRFDGLHFTIFDKSNTPELKSNVIDALQQDRQGNIWIGTVGGGLTRLSGGEFHTFTTRDGLSNDTITCLLEDNAGDLWIGTNGGGLNRFYDGRFTTFSSEQGLADNQVSALADGGDGALWVGTHDGLSRFRDGRFQTYRVRDGLPGNDIRALLMQAGQTLWIGTNNEGLSRFQQGSFRTFTTRDGLTSNSVVSLGEGPGGDLWIGTSGGGLTRLAGSGFSAYTSKNGLPSNDVWCIYRDRQQNLWIGTGGGGLVRLFSHSEITAYDSRDGLANNVTLPIFEDHAGAIWIGTNGGGLARFENGKFTSLSTRDGLADNLVFSICEGPGHALWIGTRKGLNRLKDGRLTTFTQKDGLPNSAAIVVYADYEGAVWIGTRAGLSRWKDGRFTTYTAKNGLSSNVVQSLLEDRQHRLWIGTGGGGLDLLENGRFRRFDTHSGLSNNVVLALHEDKQGSLWIGTDGGGLDRLKDGHFSVFAAKDGMPDDAVFRILEDDAGNLWMSSNKGIFRASLSKLNDFADRKIAHVSVVSYGVADGMYTNECNGGFQPAGWKARDGRLWFPTMRGVVVIDPRSPGAGGTQQTSVLEEVIVDDHRFPVRAGLKVPPGTGELEFHFTAPNLRDARRVDFKYRLEGFDTGWIQAGRRHVAYYTNIPPGHYRFRVVATNEDGAWSSAGASLPFTLEPRFVQTIYFYALCALLAGGAAVAVHLSHVRRLRERERILARHVDERTIELRDQMAERQRAELESIKAKEAAEHATRVKSEFLANMSHEIRTPMNAILGMTQLTLASELSPEQRENLEIVQDSAESLLRVIDDILDFSKVEAGKLNIDPIDFDLREALEAIRKSMSLRADQKGIRLGFFLDEDVPAAIHSDPLRLRQVVLNLVDNAIKFTDQGSVTVRVTCEAAGPLDVLLHFTISDTGIGIPAAKLASIFEAFSQADSSTTRRYGGTGLGLAICSRLVQLMGGSIGVQSEVNKGSRFHFTVLAGIATASVEPPQGPATRKAAALASLKRFDRTHLSVLVVEDNPANRLVARLTLEKFGVRVYEAGNGMEALSAAQRFRVDVILMDCRMPLMDGYEATRQIRALPEPFCKIPIIALTASAYGEDRLRAEQAGMNDFIAKPFIDMDLVKKCFSWVNSANPVAVPDVANSAGESNALLDRFNRYPPDFIREVMQMFLETAPPAFDKLVACIQARNWEDVRASAHWLRGGASRLIAPDLQERLGQLEKRCAADTPVVPAAELASLVEEFGRACRCAELWLAGNRTQQVTAAAH